MLILIFNKSFKKKFINFVKCIHILFFLFLCAACDINYLYQDPHVESFEDQAHRRALGKSIIYLSNSIQSDPLYGSGLAGNLGAINKALPYAQNVYQNEYQKELSRILENYNDQLTRKQHHPKSQYGNVAENGSYYGEISQKTGMQKTIHVKGYYRKDGTYVREHYRSRKR